MRNLFDNKIDLSKVKNLICVSITLATGMGFSIIGGIKIGNVEISALCIVMIVAVVMNIILPDEIKQDNSIENLNETKNEQELTSANTQKFDNVNRKNNISDIENPTQ